jgi:excisionase family DNA binding protein
MTTTSSQTINTVYTAEEVAAQFRCNVETVYRWARKGQIRSARKPGQRAYRFTQEHIDEYLRGDVPAPAATAPKSSRHPKYSK